MEYLPPTLEQKIENLPIVSFNNTEQLYNIIWSQDFTDIFTFYKQNYLPDLLRSKPELYQRISLYLTLTNQTEELTEKLDKTLLRRPIPTIEEYLSGRFFSYNGNATLYPYWKDKLREIFRESSPIRKVIFSGSIGVGKSTVARKAFLYVLYRLFCYRDIRSVLNIDADATIANVVISMTLKQVYETNTIAFIKLMETMPCFQRVMSQRSFENFDLNNPNCPIPYTTEKSTGNIYFPDNIIFTCGSSASHFTGYNVVNSFCFTGDTKVYTDKGTITFKELTDRFNNGEKFKTLTLDSKGRHRTTEITNALETTRTQDLIRIYYTDKDYIECTPTHPFIIKNPKLNDINIKYENGIPYKQARYLTEEDELYDSNTFYVYGLYIKDSDIPFYIGISSYTNVFEKDETKKYIRAYFHLKHPEQDNQRTYNILVNNKVNVKILNENLSDVEAYELEKQLIQKYGRIDLDENGKLTNIAKGGNTIDHADLAYGVRCSIIHKEKSRYRLIEYNKSEEHRKKTAYYNSIRPKVSSPKSKAKLAKSQSETWNKKSEIEKAKNNLSKSLGRAWNVLKRINGIYINEQIFNAHRSKGSRLANTEPLWKSIIQKANGIENFLSLIKEKYGKEFIYEN